MKRIIFIALASLLALAAFAAKKQSAPRPTNLQPDWSRNAVIYEVNLRQFTDEGTLAAFRRQIPRLKDLGVDILWFMPVNPISELNRKGTLGSYYAVKDYKAVNPEFGTAGDFRAVVDDAHAAGMRVIIDWVPNHTGCDNAWVEEHPDWYARNEKGEMYGPYDWTDVYKLDYSNPELRLAMIDALKYWLTNMGIDGFRCDVAGEVPTDFWEQARPELEKVQPELFMLAEASKPELLNNAFDADYAWPMKELFSQIAATSGHFSYVPENGVAPKFPVKHANDIDSMLRVENTKFRPGSYHMYMTSNHDLNSWEGTEFERLGRLHKAFAVLCYTMPYGMPLIYTGQETGMNRAFEFFEKDKAPAWAPRNEYFDFYKRLNKLKHQHQELANGSGDPMSIIDAGSDDLLVFVREGAKRDIYVGVNLGSETLPLKFKNPNFGKGEFFDWMTDSTVDALPAKLAPGEYFIYIEYQR